MVQKTPWLGVAHCWGWQGRKEATDSRGDEAGVSEEPSLWSRPRQGCAERLDHRDSLKRVTDPLQQMEVDLLDSCSLDGKRE